MPELPEVQTVVDELSSSLTNLTLRDVIVLRDKIRYDVPDLSPLIGSKITKVERRAKYIIINDKLVIHLGMSGKIKVGEPQERIKHDHIVFEFEDGTEMVFNDARRFGFVIYKDNKFFDHLGPEPLEDGFDVKYLHEKLREKTQPIKTAIMNQEIVVGVGNIYAAEALFRSKIRPTRKCNKISKAKYAELVKHIKDVLSEAIASGGSTLRDYVRSSGDLGYFQHSHQVYGREGEPCVTCEKPISNLRLGGRSSFFCAACQK